MKQVQDYYFKKAKKENYPARSVYKLEEVQDKYHLLKKGDAVLDLGCHPGSWSIYAAKIAGPSGKVVGLDLQKGEKLYRTGFAPMHTFVADIMAAETGAQIRAIQGQFNAVLSDMAPGTTGNPWSDQQMSMLISRQALTLAEELLVPGGNFYCKVFEGEDFSLFVKEVKERFAMAKVVKPKSSRKESREVFVLGMGFVGKR